MSEVNLYTFVKQPPAPVEEGGFVMYGFRYYQYYKLCTLVYKNSADGEFLAPRTHRPEAGRLTVRKLTSIRIEITTMKRNCSYEFTSQLTMP